MSKQFYDVDVRKVDIGHIIVKASSKEEAMRLIASECFDPLVSEFWTSISLQPLNAQKADYVPNRLLTGSKY